MILFLFSFVIAWAIGFAVFGMAVWHTYLIATGQTTIEFHMNLYKNEATRVTGEVFVNQYDLGTKRNFREFFSIGAGRGWGSVFFPSVYLPSQKYYSIEDMFRE
jgi:palmitoyltransferase